ncbi:MAG: phosphatase PAP2 family protein [Alistipes sp.]|nr:phosphatase PAP2 family protein [Alistipes sp.]
MNNVTWDWALFDVLNFDGPAWLDSLMVAISGVAMWIPLYLLIIYMIWRRYSWRGVVALLVAVGVAMGAADIIAGIFKHSGPLKHLWESFPVRLRPMFTEALTDVSVVSTGHGLYGTVSAHAATIVSLALLSSVAVGRRWFTVVMIVVAILVCYSRIYLACHFPQDILLGAVVGLVAGGAGVWLFRRVVGGK